MKQFLIQSIYYVAKNIYEVVADSLNTSVPILKSNYLNEDEEFVLERHKKTYPELYSTKSKTAKKS